MTSHITDQILQKSSIQKFQGSLCWLHGVLDCAPSVLILVWMLYCGLYISLSDLLMQFPVTQWQCRWKHFRTEMESNPVIDWIHYMGDRPKPQWFFFCDFLFPFHRFSHWYLHWRFLKYIYMYEIYIVSQNCIYL